MIPTTTEHWIPAATARVVLAALGQRNRLVALRDALGTVFDDRLLAHVWPLGWEHINLTGDYSWGKNQPAGAAALRELRFDQAPSMSLAA